MHLCPYGPIFSLKFRQKIKNGTPCLTVRIWWLFYLTVISCGQKPAPISNGAENAKAKVKLSSVIALAVMFIIFVWIACVMYFPKKDSSNITLVPNTGNPVNYEPKPFYEKSVPRPGRFPQLSQLITPETMLKKNLSASTRLKPTFREIL